MSNSYFRFLRFTIRQDRCAMKVGTDGVLLGAWAGHEAPRSILDVGTGTGLVALMMAQRYPECSVDALEVDPKAACQAKENARDSEFGSQITVMEQDFLTFKTDRCYDLIVSNPPYFKGSLNAPDPQRQMARQGEGLDFQSLVVGSRSLLSDAGRLALIAPYEKMPEILSLAGGSGYSLLRRLLVRPTAQKEPRRVLLEFSLSHGPMLEDGVLVLNKKDGTRSEHFELLTKDFYLSQ